MLTESITGDPGGSLGWHSHPGPVQVAVTSGTFSLHQVETRRCNKHTFGPGDAFVEDGGRVHLGRNERSEPVHISSPHSWRPPARPSSPGPKGLPSRAGSSGTQPKGHRNATHTVKLINEVFGSPMAA
jgi:hypothetical protein